MMKQIDFIMLSNNIKGVKVNQGNVNTVTVTLDENCVITHNYVKGNKMFIDFKNEHGVDRYLITTRVELQLIYTEHLEHLEDKDRLSFIRKYCDTNLTKIA